MFIHINIHSNLWFFFPALCYLLLSVPERYLSENKLTLPEEQAKILYDARENFG